MRIYYADIRGLDESKAKYPPKSASHGSAFGMSLLAIAYEDYNAAVMPKLNKFLRSRPCFPGNEQLHYSISHSRTHVAVAVSKQPVGLDTLDLREIKPEMLEKLTTAAERENLTFHEIWSLREAFFKLKGEGDLRTLRFYRKNGKIDSPDPAVHCRLYPDIEKSTLAVCSYADTFPDKIIKIPSEKLLRDNNRLDREIAKHTSST